jgi:Xaa-Pro aminopeptidase
MALFRDYVVHTPEEIERIRVAMQMTAQVRDQLAELVKAMMKYGDSAAAYNS